jgi:hypothetical protein
MAKGNTIQYLYKEGGASRKRTDPWIVLFDPPSWPLRILRSRGYTGMKLVHERKMTEEESFWYKTVHRCLAYSYRDVSQLIEDELNVLDDKSETIKLLKTFQTNATTDRQ